MIPKYSKVIVKRSKDDKPWVGMVLDSQKIFKNIKNRFVNYREYLIKRIDNNSLEKANAQAVKLIQ